VAAGLIRGARVLVFLVVASSLAGGCGVGAVQSPRVTPPSVPGGSGEAISPAIAQTRTALVQALGTVRLILDDPRVPFRPPESPSMAEASRQVFQAVLPDDPGHGYIAVYEFPTATAASVAAADQAAYVTSGPGRVQFPPDTQFVLRRLGSTVVFYAYSRENSPDPRVTDLVTALGTVGEAVPIPR
jgi:hypothetical protein